MSIIDLASMGKDPKGILKFEHQAVLELSLLRIQVHLSQFQFRTSIQFDNCSVEVCRESGGKFVVQSSTKCAKEALHQKHGTCHAKAGAWKGHASKTAVIHVQVNEVIYCSQKVTGF